MGERGLTAAALEACAERRRIRRTRARREVRAARVEAHTHVPSVNAVPEWLAERKAELSERKKKEGSAVPYVRMGGGFIEQDDKRKKPNAGNRHRRTTASGSLPLAATGAAAGTGGLSHFMTCARSPSFV